MVANHNRLWGHIVKTKISRIFQFTKSFFNFFCGPSRLRSEGLSVTGTNVTITPMDQNTPTWDYRWVDLSVFYFLKTCWSYPLKTSNTTGRDCVSPFIPTKSHSRRRLSAESFFKSWFEDSEYLLLIVDTFGPQTQDSWMQIRCDRHLHQWPSNKPSVLTTVLDFIDGWFPITCYECTIEQGPSQYTLGHFNSR